MGCAGQFGYLEPDATGPLKYMSLLDKVPAEHRLFTDVWQTLVTQQGTFFRSYERLFRWDGRRMQVWVAPGIRFSGVAATPYYAALALGLVGVWRVDVVIPANAPTGNTVGVTMSCGSVAIVQ